MFTWGWRSFLLQGLFSCKLHYLIIIVLVRRYPTRTCRGGTVWIYYSDVIMSAMASQITGVSIIYSTVYSGADQRKHQSSAPLAFVRGIHRWPVNSLHKGPVKRKMVQFDDVIMLLFLLVSVSWYVPSHLVRLLTRSDQPAISGLCQHIATTNLIVAGPQSDTIRGPLY